jgi:hypothetical protein
MQIRTLGWSAALVAVALGLSVTLAAAALGIRAEGAPRTPPAAVGEETVVLVGKLEVAETNLIGQARSVALVDPQLGRFVIANEGEGKALKRYIGEGVTVIGVVKPCEAGDHGFVVTAYRLHYT